MLRYSSSNYNDLLDSSEFILKLNDDCLLKIFEYLSLYDQITLTTVSKRFSNILLLFSRTHKTFHARFYDNYNKKIPWMENNYLIELIKLLPFDELKTRRLNENDLMKILQAQNLTKLSNLHIADNCIKELPRYGNLSKLILRNCALNDDFIKTLSENQENLKYLDLSNNVNVYGDYLKNFHQLETLILKYCFEVKEQNLIKAFKNNASLKHVNVKYCHNFFNRAFIELPCDLISLSFCYNSQNKINFTNKIFPCLKCLVIGRSDETPIPIASILKNIKSPYMEKLKINFVSNSEVSSSWSSLLKETFRFENISQLILNLYAIENHELDRFDWSHLKRISLKSLKLRLYPEHYGYFFRNNIENNNMINFIHETKFIENFEIDYQNNECLSFAGILFFTAKVFLKNFKPTITIQNMVHGTHRRTHLLCKCSESEKNKKNVILTTYDFDTKPRDRCPYSHFLHGVSSFVNNIDSIVQELHIIYFAPKAFSELCYLIEDMLKKELSIRIQIEIHSTKQLLDNFFQTPLYELSRTLYNIKAYYNNDLLYKTIDEIMYSATYEAVDEAIYSLEIS